MPQAQVRTVGEMDAPDLFRIKSIHYSVMAGGFNLAEGQEGVASVLVPPS